MKYRSNYTSDSKLDTIMPWDIEEENEKKRIRVRRRIPRHRHSDEPKSNECYLTKIFGEIEKTQYINEDGQVMYIIKLHSRIKKPTLKAWKGRGNNKIETESKHDNDKDLKEKIDLDIIFSSPILFDGKKIESISVKLPCESTSREEKEEAIYSYLTSIRNKKFDTNFIAKCDDISIRYDAYTELV